MLQVLHELWDFVIGGHPCPTDTFLVHTYTSQSQKFLICKKHM